MNRLNLLALASGTVCWALAGTAHAATTVMGDLDYALPISSPYHAGPGFGVRFGQQIHIPLLTLTPELGFTYQSLRDDPAVYRGVVGLRAGIGEVFRPGIFAHVGLGTLGRGVPPKARVTYDGGVFLDLTLIPLITFGAHIAYQHLNAVKDQEALRCMLLGVHAGLVF